MLLLLVHRHFKPDATQNDEKKKESMKSKRKGAGSIEDRSQHGKRSKKELAKKLLTGLHKHGYEPDLAELRKERLNRERREREKTRDLLKS